MDETSTIKHRPWWWIDFLTTPQLEFASLSTTGGTVGELLNAAMDPTISYDDLDLIRSMWPGKLVVKGVQSVADATRLVDRGGRRDHLVQPRRSSA